MSTNTENKDKIIPFDPSMGVKIDYGTENPDDYRFPNQSKNDFTVDENKSQEEKGRAKIKYFENKNSKQQI